MKEQKHKHAVAAIIEYEGRFLFGKRSAHKRIAPLFWCPVTGKIEKNESEEKALVREVFEEVGLHVKPLKKICSTETKNQDLIIHWWTAKIIDGVAYLKNDEHTELRWVTKEEMNNLDPAYQEDIAIFQNLLN